MSLISFSKNGDVSEEEIRRGIDLDMGSGSRFDIFQLHNFNCPFHGKGESLLHCPFPISVPLKSNSFIALLYIYIRVCVCDSTLKNYRLYGEEPYFVDIGFVSSAFNGRNHTTYTNHQCITKTSSI